MALYAKVTCFPPLGQLSVIPATSEEIAIHAVLEVTREWNDIDWEIALCYRNKRSKNSGRSKWSEIQLLKSSSSPPVIDHTPSTHYTAGWSNHTTYSGTLPTSVLDNAPVTFTIKHRIDKHAPWMWMDQITGTPPGELVWQRPLDTNKSELQSLKLESGWNMRSTLTKTTNATSIVIESENGLQRDHETDSTFQYKTLGRIEKQLRFMAVTRYSDMWLGPQHGESIFDIWADAIMVCFITENGHHTTLVAMSDASGIMNLLQSGDDGEIIVKARNDTDRDTPSLIVAAEALTINDSIEAAMNEARNIIFDTPNVGESLSIAKIPSEKISNMLENWYDGFSFCTYNSLGVDLTFEKISVALDSLASHNINVSTLIIDDNWQTVDDSDPKTWSLHRTWLEFEANKRCFPDGLKAGIQRLRLKYPRIEKIAVWHALFGYWAGLHPKGELAEKYQTPKVPSQLIPHIAKDLDLVKPSDIHRMYDDFYAFLSSCGIECVKTDVQYMLDMFQSSSDRASYPEKYLSAWTTAHLRHFNGRAISCMSMTPQILFQYLPKSLPRVLLRNSDDYFPEIPSSHAQHLFINAHNALFTQHLNVIPDWDMFQTSHAFAGYHAAARCLSGCMVYITDKPSEHDLDLINQMTAPAPSGRTISLRPTNICTSLAPYTSFTSGQVLKIGCSTGSTAKGSSASLLGIFNIAEKPISFLLAAADFPNLTQPPPPPPDSAALPPRTQTQTHTHLLRSHLQSRILPPITYTHPYSATGSDPRTFTFITLPEAGYDILTAHPIHAVALPSRAAGASPAQPQLELAVLGLLGKLTGAAAVMSTTIEARGDVPVRVAVRLKALGRLGVWVGVAGEGGGSRDGNGIANLAVHAEVEGLQVGREWVQDAAGVRVDGAGRVVEIDVLGFLGARAWAGGEEQGEVEVVVLLG